MSDVHTQGVSKTLGQTSHRKTGEKVHTDICPQTLSCRNTAPTFARPHSFEFYLWGHLKATMYSAPIENEETIHQRIFYASLTTGDRLGNFEIVQQSVTRCVHVCNESGRGYFEHLS